VRHGSRDGTGYEPAVAEISRPVTARAALSHSRIPLFRKFASDFADKYRIQPLKLTDEAKETLIKYRFPGNIRQLKNIVEQISVLETNREINNETLLKYLPQTTTLPAIMKDRGAAGEEFTERDLLYKILFDMKKDMSELKKLVFELLKHEGQGKQMLQDHRDLFHSVSNEAGVENTYVLKDYKKDNQEPIDIDKIEDIPHETEEESLSLEHQEKGMIMKALKKNNNKRKYAARDLGISERTLYRKIKEYEIEE